MQKIAIHGVPRSGTTWLGELINSSEEVAYRYQPLFSYAFKNYLGPDCTKKHVEDFFQKIAESSDPFLLQQDARSKNLLPTFKKKTISIIAYKEVRYHYLLPSFMRKLNDLKLIVLVRNPMAVISSWLNAPREFREDLGWVRTEEWRYALKKNINRPEEYNGYEKWKEATQLFCSLADQYPTRVLMITYGSLVAQTQEMVSRIFQATGIPMTRQTLNFIDPTIRETDSEPYSINRIKHADDDWKSALEPQIIEAITGDLEGTSLERFLEM